MRLHNLAAIKPVALTAITIRLILLPIEFIGVPEIVLIVIACTLIPLLVLWSIVLVKRDIEKERLEEKEKYANTE